jgi:hypothetical protein
MKHYVKILRAMAVAPERQSSSYTLLSNLAGVNQDAEIADDIMAGSIFTARQSKTILARSCEAGRAVRAWRFLIHEAFLVRGSGINTVLRRLY